MHIDPPATPPIPGGAPAPRPLGPRPDAPAPAPAVPGTSSRLRATSGDFDAARVAQLREAIASGRHAVDLGRVADGLVRHLRELGS